MRPTTTGYLKTLSLKSKSPLFLCAVPLSEQVVVINGQFVVVFLHAVIVKTIQVSLNEGERCENRSPSEP